MIIYLFSVPYSATLSA